MSITNFLEKSYYQTMERFTKSGQKISDKDRIDLIESILYGAFQRRKVKNLKPKKMPLDMLDGIKLQWLDSSGKVEISCGNLKKVRNFNSKKQSASADTGVFAIKKDAFGQGVLPELIVEKGETKVLKTDVVHDYKKIHIKEGGKIVADKKGKTLILLANNELIMEDKSRIEWVGKNGDSFGSKNLDPAKDGKAGEFAFDFFNGRFDSIKDVENSKGEDGKEANGGEAGESAGVIWIEARKMNMIKNSAIRALGGDGGVGPGGNGAGGNGGAVIVKTTINIDTIERKIAVTEGRSAGHDGLTGVKVVENLY